MRIAVASDHAGLRYKDILGRHLTAEGHEVVDFGTSTPAPVDYPDFVRLAAAAVARGECERGIVVGGSGNGEAIAANRFRGVRCAVCWNEASARLAQAHNAANMIAIGARMISEELAIRILVVWMTTPFENGRHARRIRKLDLLP